MKIIAYLYWDPLLESSLSQAPVWSCEVDWLYQDWNVVEPKQPKGQKRPQLLQLLQDQQTRPADYLLIRKLEDLGDSLAEISDCLAELHRLGLHVMTADPGLALEQILAQTEKPIPDLRLDLLQLLQAIQRQHRSRQIRQGHARNRLRALPPPGKAPYGYRRAKEHYALDRSAAGIVKDFFEQFLRYGSLSHAVRYIAKKHGKNISVSTGHRWLTNPVYRGHLAYQTGEIRLHTHTPILSKDEAAQVDRLLRRNRRLPPRSASAPHSLAGLVVCKTCQTPMGVIRTTTLYREKVYLYLRPTACPQRPRCPSIPYQQALEQIIQQICEDLPQAVTRATLPNVEGVQQSLQAAIAQKERVLSQLPTLVTTGILDTEIAELRAYKLRTEIATLNTQLAQLPPVNLQALAQTVSNPQFWQDLPEIERRFYFREFIRQVHVARQEEGWQYQLAFVFDEIPGNPQP